MSYEIDVYDQWADDEMLRVTTDYLVRRGYIIDTASDPIIERLCWYVSPLDQWMTRIEPNRHNGATEYGPFYAPDEAFRQAAQLRRALALGVMGTPKITDQAGSAADWWDGPA